MSEEQDKAESPAYAMGWTPMSSSIAEIATALCAAQREIGAAKRDSTNPHFKSKYASYESVRTAVEAAFAKHELTLTHLGAPAPVGHTAVSTVLLHGPSGQWISTTVTIPNERPTAHGVGSATSYACRYGLTMIAAVPMHDDDGNAAAGAGSNKAVRKNRTKAAPDLPEDINERMGSDVTKRQQEAFAELTKDIDGGLVEAALDKYNVKNFAQLDRDTADKIIAALRESQKVTT